MIQFQLKSMGLWLPSLLFFLLLMGCSQSQKRSSEPKKKISLQENLSFEEIERKKAIARYQEMREVRILKLNHKIQRWRKFKRLRPKPYKKTITKIKRTRQIPTIKKPALTPEQLNELDIEIKQNLAYFCMRNRKNKRFSEPSSCREYTQNIYSDCQKKYKREKDRRLLNCLKKALR